MFPSSGWEVLCFGFSFPDLQTAESQLVKWQQFILFADCPPSSASHNYSRTVLWQFVLWPWGTPLCERPAYSWSLTWPCVPAGSVFAWEPALIIRSQMASFNVYADNSFSNAGLNVSIYDSVFTCSSKFENHQFNHVTEWCGCGSGGVGPQLIRRLMVQPSAGPVCMPNYPWQDTKPWVTSSAFTGVSMWDRKC